MRAERPRQVQAGIKGPKPPLSETGSILVGGMSATGEVLSSRLDLVGSQLAKRDTSGVKWKESGRSPIFTQLFL